MQLIEKVLEQGKSSILLVPEISLTPQMVDRFIRRFGEEKIAVLHSKLSIGERYDEWRRIQKGVAQIVIGARSAVFAPVKDLGIIIIDEEHDTSYQSEMSPRYDAKEVARKMAKEKEVPLVLGSATPSMTTYYQAQKGNIALLELTKRANSSHLPTVDIIDMREQLAKGNRSMLSTQLYTAVEENLKNKRQTILFLNRRGYSTFIMCRDCGYTLKCKNCDITLTYHLRENKLKCHYCGYEEKPSTICPNCQSRNIRYFGSGTQKLEEEIHKIFPMATTIRMDTDTVSKKNGHEVILEKFKNENIDILIGTQMVVKGHHFPNVTLVGVMAADGSLNIEDFRANERTFQILTQVAGRAGRENLPGKVIVQTYNPDSLAIQYAAKQDYKAFYQAEIGIRKQLKYPPFCDIIMIGIQGKDENKVMEIAQNLYEYYKTKMQEQKLGILLYRPVASPITQIKKQFRFRILIKCLYDEKIRDFLQQGLDFIQKKTKDETRVMIEINPSNML